MFCHDTPYRNLCRRLAAFATLICLVAVSLAPAQVQAQKPTKKNTKSNAKQETEEAGKNMESIVLGGGCFWCVEAVFLRVQGVSKVESAYSGGHVPNPTYEQICTGATGHAEVIRVTFDPEVVSLEQILVIFFKTHDPTTLNRQGNDVGTQYRSVVFYADDKQKEATEAVIKKITEENFYDAPIVTEVSPLGDVYVAEDYHQNYFKRNPANPYCQNVVASKVRKFEKLFKDYSVTGKK